MTKLLKALTAALTLAALVGCGTAPASAPSVKRTVSAKAPSSTTLKKTTAAPKVSSRPGSATPAKANKPKAEAPAPASEAGGALKFAITVSGNAPVANLAVKIFEQADPTLAMDVPLTVSNGKAVWAEDEIPPGRYTLQVKALGADGTYLGQGSTEAVVREGEVSEVSLDLRVNVLGAQDTNNPPAGEGAVLDLNIEII